MRGICVFVVRFLDKYGLGITKDPVKMELKEKSSFLGGKAFCQTVHMKSWEIWISKMPFRFGLFGRSIIHFCIFWKKTSLKSERNDFIQFAKKEKTFKIMGSRFPTSPNVIQLVTQSYQEPDILHSRHGCMFYRL